MDNGLEMAKKMVVVILADHILVERLTQISEVGVEDQNPSGCKRGCSACGCRKHAQGTGRDEKGGSIDNKEV